MSTSFSARANDLIVAKRVLAVAAVALVAPAALAQVTSTWTGASGNWTNPAIWSTNPNYPNNGMPPGALYDAFLQGSVANVVTVDAPITIQRLLLARCTITGTNSITALNGARFSGGVLSAPLSLPTGTSSAVDAPSTVGSITGAGNMAVTAGGDLSVSGNYNLSGTTSVGTAFDRSSISFASGANVGGLGRVDSR